MIQANGNGTLKKYLERLHHLQQELRSKDSTKLTNHEKRVTHARIELLRLDLTDDLLFSSPSQQQQRLSPLLMNEINAIEKELDLLDEQLKLSFVTSSSSLFYQLHDLLRLLIVLYLLFTSGMIISLPLLLLRVTDSLFASLSLPRPYKPICVATKAFISNLILLTSGVVLKTQGLNHQTFLQKRTLACFTHASTLDAFVLGATLPTPATVLAKKELFILPYFGWLMQAYGNVPIDRKNRNSAVVSLEIATELSDIVLIAPEGTRSTTGQLLPFKKGPFHLWESLHGPIVPIVVTGAYELLPPGDLSVSLSPSLFLY
jgi:1-acyl-sn-glycerol-3-phosphate acyltransferase